MQRPEAWPRPHPGDGAAGTQTGVPAPPAQAGESSGLREPSLYTIKAVFILDNDGHRLLAKYYDDTFSSSKEQMTFEKNVFDKTSRAESALRSKKPRPRAASTILERHLEGKVGNASRPICRPE